MDDFEQKLRNEISNFKSKIVEKSTEIEDLEWEIKILNMEIQMRHRELKMMKINDAGKTLINDPNN